MRGPRNTLAWARAVSGQRLGPGLLGSAGLGSRPSRRLLSRLTEWLLGSAGLGSRPSRRLLSRLTEGLPLPGLCIGRLLSSGLVIGVGLSRPSIGLLLPRLSVRIGLLSRLGERLLTPRLGVGLLSPGLGEGLLLCG